MDERRRELKRLNKVSQKAKRKHVTGWKIAAVFMLVIAVIFAPLSIAVMAFDNVAAHLFGGRFWELVEGDESAVYFESAAHSLEDADAAVTETFRNVTIHGAVLLKNEKQALPLRKAARIGLFASSFGGDLHAALEKAGFVIAPKEETEGETSTYCDAAIILADNIPSVADTLKELSQRRTAGKLNKMILLTRELATPAELLQYDIDAALWIGSAGSPEGIAELLAGAVSPSGRLPMTGTLVQAKETDRAGIYTGYPYFETCYEDLVMGGSDSGDFTYDNTVAYPFGYGLSYATFAYSDMQVIYNEKADRFEIAVTVTNTGNRPAMEVVQVYVQTPYTEYAEEHGVEKASVRLAGFAKTETIAPGEKTMVTVVVDKCDLASYDAAGAGAYVLDAGDYYLTAAHDAHGAVNNILAAKGYTPENTDGRMDENGDGAFAWKWVQDTLETVLPLAGQTHLQNSVETMPTLGAQNGLRLWDMMGLAFDDVKWQTLLDQLTFEDMAALIGDSWGWSMPMLSVQAPGVRHDNAPALDDLSMATFCPELLKDQGERLGDRALLDGNGLLHSAVLDWEDSFLAGKLLAAYTQGIQHKGITAVLDFDTLPSGLVNEQTARQHYLRAIQYAVEGGRTVGVMTEYPLAEIFRGEWGSQGMLLSPNGPTAEDILSGVTAFTCVLPDGEETLLAYRDVPEVVWAMREACHYHLYTLVNSAAMNGIGEHTTVQTVTLPAIIVCWAVAACSTVLFVVFAIFWRRGGRKWKKSQGYLDYKTMKATLREERKM